jgi:hypothetical protein
MARGSVPPIWRVVAMCAAIEKSRSSARLGANKEGTRMASKDAGTRAAAASGSAWWAAGAPFCTVHRIASRLDDH